MNPNETRPLGKTDLRLPVLGFGGAPLGDMATQVAEKDAAETLDTAWDLGVRYFDTSPWYGRGQSEHRIGRSLYRRPRQDVVISTKVGRILSSPKDLSERANAVRRSRWAGGLDLDAHFDYSYDGVMRSYEDSIQRLGMNRIDLLLIHDLDMRNHKIEWRFNAHLDQLIGGGYRALSNLKAAGLIKAIGAGVNDLGTMPLFSELFDLDFFLLAKRYTLGEQRTLDGEDQLCAEKGISLIIGSVFSTGLYAVGAGKGARYNYRIPTAAEEEKAARIETICSRYEVPLPAAAMQFPLLNPNVCSIVPGAFSVEQVQSNVNYMRIEIPADLWRELKHEGLIRADAWIPN